MISSRVCGFVDVDLGVFDLLAAVIAVSTIVVVSPFVGALQSDGDNGAGLQVDRMLGFVG